MSSSGGLLPWSSVRLIMQKKRNPSKSPRRLLRSAHRFSNAASRPCFTRNLFVATYRWAGSRTLPESAVEAEGCATMATVALALIRDGPTTSADARAPIRGGPTTSADALACSSVSAMQMGATMIAATEVRIL